ncbi:hypothetical protein SY88_10270 [Clostridiales bacterium PH28_bin88]|nr:hypothetical protein SY88_10270 [Clostridiales bacterium PH28_bin88]
MKKKVIAGLVVALVLALALPIAFAADSGTTPPPSKRPFINFDQSQLDENEMKELNAIHDQMLNLRKQMIKKYVEFGAISQEDADALTARMDEKAKWQKENGFTPGFGHGMKGGKRGGFRGGWSTKAPTS